jgi:hypothetical protein
MGLTQKRAERAAPAAKRYFMNDSGTQDAVTGLRLAVFPSGEKSWQVRTRIGKGRNAPERTGTLGSFATLTLEQARKMAAEIIRQAKQGLDTMADARRSDGYTVEVLWEEFFREHRKKLTSRMSVVGYEREARVFTSDFGAMPVTAVTRGIIVRWQEKNEHRPVLWNKAYKRLKQAWKWGIETRKIPRDLDIPSCSCASTHSLRARPRGWPTLWRRSDASAWPSTLPTSTRHMRTASG